MNIDEALVIWLDGVGFNEIDCERAIMSDAILTIVRYAKEKRAIEIENKISEEK